MTYHLANGSELARGTIPGLLKSSRAMATQLKATLRWRATFDELLEWWPIVRRGFSDGGVCRRQENEGILFVQVVHLNAAYFVGPVDVSMPISGMLLMISHQQSMISKLVSVSLLFLCLRRQPRNEGCTKFTLIGLPRPPQFGSSLKKDSNPSIPKRQQHQLHNHRSSKWLPRNRPSICKHALAQISLH